MAGNKDNTVMKSLTWTIAFLLLLLILAGIIYASVNAEEFPGWTGIPEYDAGSNRLIRPKTLWDWLDLFIVSTVVALGFFWLRIREDRRDAEKQEQERARQLDNQRQTALNDYFDNMSELILEKGLGQEALEAKANSEVVVVIARARTLAILRILDPIRVAAVFRFLNETGLRNVVLLIEADLHGVNWQSAFLREANLSGAVLYNAVLTDAILRRANLNRADLRSADLRGTYLREANLGEAILRGAQFEGALYDNGTVWPEGFDPEHAGAVMVEPDFSMTMTT